MLFRLRVNANKSLIPQLLSATHILALELVSLLHSGGFGLSESLTLPFSGLCEGGTRGAMSTVRPIAPPAADFPGETSTYSHTYAGRPRYDLGDEVDSNDPEDQSRGNDLDEDSHCEDEVDDAVKEDMMKLESSFRGISERYKLVNRIGEGIFYSSIPTVVPATNR